MRKTNKSILLIFALLIAVVLSLSAVSAEDVAIDGDIASVDDSISDVSSEDLSIADESPVETIDTASDVSTSTDDSTLGDGDSSSWYVDSKVETTGDGSQASPFKTIGEAFNASQGNGTIYLASGVYNTSDDRGLRLNSGGNLSIIGAGSDETVIDMLSQSTSFISSSIGSTFYLSNIKLINPANTAITCANLTIENSVFANGYYYSGAPILSIGAGDTIIRDCVFENSSSGYWNGAGVAIFRSSNSNTLFENCLFKNNTNPGGASVFYTSYCTPNLTINNCNITECPQAIYGEFANLVINNSYFYNNDLNKTSNSNKFAGCFYIESGNLTIDSSKFENNTGGNYAIMSTSSSTNGANVNMTIVNSEFNNNFVGYSNYGYYTDACFGFIPRSGGSLYLRNNTGIFGNHSFVSVMEPLYGGNSTILSDLNIVVLDNTTYDLNTIQFNVIGTLTDDMGNPINMTGFDLYFNDVLVGSKLTFKSGVNDYSFKEALNGSYLVKYVYNGNNVDLTSLNVKTSIINVVPLESVDVYVATDGSDETGDGTEANPFATIEKALDVAATALNANVYIKGGTYNYRTFKNIDTANGELNILAYEGDVTIDMGGQSRFCNVSNRSNVLIKGIYFVNGYQSNGDAEDNGIINSHGNLTVKECRFANNSGYYSTIFGDSIIDSCIFESNSYNKQELREVRAVYNSTFYGASGGRTAIDFYSNYNHNYNLTVENCKFYDDAMVFIESGNATIKSSEFINISQRAVETQGAVVLTIDNCTFKDISNDAINLYQYGSTTIVNISNSKFINITYDRAIYLGNAQKAYLENNTVDMNNPYVYVYNGYIASPTTILVLNNETVEEESFGAILKAKILDDNGNTISLRSFTFEFDGKNITGSLSYDEMAAKVLGIFNGTYLVSGSSTNLLDVTVKTGVLIITPLMNKDLYVSTTGSDETGDGTEANPFATLQKAMSEAIAYNNTIHVDDGTYNIDAALEIDTNTAIVNIVGNGENTIFDMGKQVRFISSISQNSIITIENLSLINGAITTARQAGGTIVSSGDLTIKNVNFINSTASVTRGDGGAISSSGNLTVIDSYFESNVATRYGGAIYSTGNTYVANSIFNNTSAGTSGGAIYSSNYLYIKNNTFIDTSANNGKNIYAAKALEGGIVFTVMDNDTWTIDSTSVTLNATLTDDNNNPIYASNIPVSFLLNGIQIASASINGEKVTASANLKLNGEYVLSAKLGTAEDIIVKTATLNFVNPDVLHDVYVSSEGNDDTGDGTQENPFASFTKALSVVESMNGVIHVMTNMNSSQINSITDLHNLTIKGENSDIFIGNITTGFIMLQSGSLNLVNLRFTEASYPTYLIFTRAGTTLSLENCSYENVNYQKDGLYATFIDSSSDLLSLKNCKFINNVFNLSELTNGLIRSKSNTTFENCVFANNSFTNKNGALGGNFLIFTNNRKVLLENCTFENNNAILISLQSNSTVNNCSFINNTGRVIYASYPISLTNNNFTSNNGTVISISNGEIINNTISSNNASELISVSGQVLINNNTIKENNANTFVYASGSAIVNIHDNTLDLGDMTYVNLTGNSKITGSTFTLTVNDNATYEIEGLDLVFNASLVDADGNIIYGPMVYFTLNGDDIISANLVPVAIANAKFGGEGEFIASARTNAIYDPNELTVKTSVFTIKQIQEKIIYVDVLGNDETGDGSEENPYASLERAIQDAGGLSNIIYIQPGVYENMALGSQFTLIDDQKLSIIGLSNEVDKVVIKGLNKTFADITYTFGKYSDDQFAIKNIEFVDANLSTYFIRTNYVNNVLVDNVVFNNITTTNLITGDNSNVKVINSTLNAISGSTVLYTENLTVLDSVITNNYGYRIFQVGNRNVADLTISNSVLLNNSYIGSLIYEQWTSNKTLENNWWGNNTNADELRTLTGVDIANWIVAEVTANDSDIQIGDTVKFDLILKLNDGSDLTDILPTRIVKAIADNTAFDPESVEVVNNAATITGTVSGTGDITISIDNQDFVFDVKGYNAYITVDNVAIKLGETATVTVTFTDDNGPLANKELAVNVNGEESTVTTDADGKATIPLADLAKGNHIVEVNFAGDNMHDPVTGAGLVMVSDAVLTVNIPEVSYGESPTINVELKDSEGNPLSGLVTVNINGKDYNVLVKDGEGSLAVPDKFDAGEYTISAKLIGDSITESTATFVVDKLASAMTVTVADVAYGEPFVINLDIADKTVSGLSIVTINGVDYAVEVVNGAASKAINAILPGGSYDVTAKFIGDNYDIADASTTFAVSEIVGTNVALTVKDIQYGENQTVTVTLTDANGNPISGLVKLTVGDIEQNITVDGESSVVLENLNAGNYAAIANYIGDDAYAPSNGYALFKVEKLTTYIDYQNMTTTAVDVDTDGRIGKYFYITLKDSNGKAIAGQKVQIGFNGVVYDRVTDDKGQAKLQINLKNAGTYTFAVSCLGDENYNGSFIVAKIVVNKQKGSLTVPAKSYTASAKTKTLTATFKSASGKVVKGKKISFTLNGKTYTATTDAKGVAKVNVSISKKGTYTVTAKFAGNTMYDAITKTAKLTIK